ncbi:MAG: PolC-type DNA polymerase III [Lachnospiraceae bacterium]|nr:PolC-type DNA polymerase III [Lachnospiraceae bacterium]
MAQNFTEVFPALKLEKSIHDLFSKVWVEKVKMTRQRDFIRIYISSNRLIHKAVVYKVENEIKKQLFREQPVRIKIFENFKLSAQYNAEKLLHIYQESIILELKDKPVLLSILKNTKISYPNEKQLLLTIDASLLIENKAAELAQYFSQVFNERCGLSVEIIIDNEENKRKSRDDDAKIRARINEVTNIARGELKVNEDSVPDSIRIQPQENNEPIILKEETDTLVAEKIKRPPARKSRKRSDNPDVLYGRDFDDGEFTPLKEIIGEIGEVIIRGQIIFLDFRSIKNEKMIVIFSLTDFTDTIKIKLFVGDEMLDELKENIKYGVFVKIKGIVLMDKFDGDLTIGSIVGIKKTLNFTTKRLDEAKLKRVELHCHTKMSDMDGVSEAGRLIERAFEWGHSAIAITDHGVVQAFPDAYKAWKKIYNQEKKRLWEKEGKEPPAEADFFKVIYGVEAYLVDDLREIATNAGTRLLDDEYVVFDIETTGFSPLNNRIIEIGAVRVIGGNITKRYQSFINPNVPIPYEIERLTGINDEMVLEAPDIEAVLPEFLSFVGERPLVAHNANFDMSFIKENCRRQGLVKEFTYLDTLAMARILLPELKKHTLDTICKALKINQKNHHRADDDAECTAQIFNDFCSRLKEKGVKSLKEVNMLNNSTPELVKKLPSFHVIILAANDIGRENLYTLISESHLNYYRRRPRIPKSLLMEYREGLIVGSACEAGELYSALIEGKSAADMSRIVNFYDYLEIQPAANNQFMLKSEKIPAVNSLADIHELNRKIVKLGEDYHKPVVAACDVHFLDPDDEVYRRIIMAGQGYDDADDQAPLYLRTTDEMLDEFAYLGREKAFEIVVENTNKIAAMISPISPLRADKCPPVIENSDKELEEICFRRAFTLYGNPLPELVKNRLDKELNSIIQNGFAVMYIIAQKLVWKSLEDGYLVGSRGSVGSSFVATMAGITEVNPLRPHYYCLTCFYSDFDSEVVQGFAGRTGFDLPDLACPKCGEELKKDGFDIPFETFLGFNGDKEPDIDLNFSGEYQSKAHKYTEVIFGSGQTFRAGTISTLADKTAFGYVKKYFDERGQVKRNCEIDRIVSGCTGIRKSTGQHPGGIIILPLGEKINSFTPVQRPANDVNSDIITTHFDYHSIDHNLLKLDILGHDDPTMVRMLQDLTGVDPLSIPFQDEEVMSLFQNTKALKVTPEQIGGCRLGAMGVPEFGTDFVIQMLEDTKPQSFFDLICISGLSHGTDVWLGNAQELIKEGKATISTVISTRDDIMTYLINKGVDSSLSFNITESVRRGRGLTDEWKEAMKAAKVPDWYIWSCEKIKYMFPKAHAAAYVMMAWRIAYFKVYYPLAYYAAFFSIRASAFNYEIMCQGQKHLERAMADYKQREEIGKLTKKEQDSYRDMRIVQEMYARGFEFVPLDIYTAKAHDFQLIDGKIMPSLSSIEGLGDKAADAVVEAKEMGKYLSRDDFRQRAKVSKTVVELMERLGLFGELPESNQMNIFDLL